MFLLLMILLIAWTGRKNIRKQLNNNSGINSGFHTSTPNSTKRFEMPDNVPAGMMLRPPTGNGQRYFSQQYPARSISVVGSAPLSLEQQQYHAAGRNRVNNGANGDFFQAASRPRTSSMGRLSNGQAVPHNNFNRPGAPGSPHGLQPPYAQANKRPSTQSSSSSGSMQPLANSSSNGNRSGFQSPTASVREEPEEEPDDGALSGATLLNTNEVLSMPGFLQLEYGTQFRTTSKLSQGGSACVFQGEIFSNVTLPVPYENPVVVKQMMVKDKKHSKRILLAFRQEVALLWYLHDHPNIVKLVGFSERDMMIVMKFYSRGSLYSLIYNKSYPSLYSMTVQLLLDIGNALRILHNTGIVHNDLKPANVLLEDTEKKGHLRAVLADFGISHVVDNRISGVHKMVVQNVVGASTLYAAPEVLLRLKKLPTPLSPRVARGGDTYSFGIVMFELMNRRLWDVISSKKPATPNPK